MSYVQWINLPKDSVFVDASDGIGSINQLGEVAFIIHLDKPPPTGAKPAIVVTATPTVEPHPYSGFESSYGPHSFWMMVEHDTKNTWKGLGRLPAAGGNEYKVEACLDGDKVSSRTIRTRRKLFFQDFVMKGVSLVPVAGVLAKLDECAVVLRRPAPAGGLSHRAVLNYDKGSTASSTLYREAAKSWQMAKYEPYAFAVLWVDQVGMPEEKSYRMSLSAGSSIAMWASEGYAGGKILGFKLPHPDFLWWEADPDDDKQNSNRGIWLVKGSAVLHRKDGTQYAIPDADVSVGRPSLNAPAGAYDRVLFRIPTAEVATGSELEVSVVIVSGYAAGLSFPTTNVIMIVKRCWYREVGSNRATTFMHEVGHKLGLVPDGTTGLDKGTKHYSGQGHVGGHCAAGVAYDATAKTMVSKDVTYDPATKDWSGTPGCVMFGGTSIGNKASPATFCGDCRRQLCQIDLNCKRLPGFNVSFTTL